MSYTELLDRRLRYDGVSEVEPDQLVRFLLLGVPPSKLRTAHETPEVTQFNSQVADEEAIKVVGAEPLSLDLSWELPQPYANLDLERHVLDKFEQVSSSYSAEQRTEAAERIAAELLEVERRGLLQFARAVVYILDELKKNNVMWGVGRGSSCASYLLFLIGLHVVDCVKMNVPMEEFYHDN